MPRPLAQTGITAHTEAVGSNGRVHGKSFRTKEAYIYMCRSAQSVSKFVELQIKKTWLTCS